MRNSHKNKTMIWMAMFSSFISMLVIALGFWYGNELQKEVEPSTLRIESPESKLMMVAMRCHTLEQDSDILRIRIEELEDAVAMITNKPTEQKIKINTPLAVDDLITTNSL